MSTFQKASDLLAFKVEFKENVILLARWLNNMFYTIRNMGIRISFRLDKSCFDEEEIFLAQDYVMLVKIPFQKIPSTIEVDIDEEGCWNRFSTNVLKTVYGKLKRHYLYTDPNNIPPCRGDILRELEAEIKRRDEENEAKKVRQSQKVRSIRGFIKKRKDQSPL